VEYELEGKLEFRPGTEWMKEKAQKKWAFSIVHFKALPRLLAQKGYVSFEGGKYWEGPYQKAGFTDGMSKDWKPEYLKEYGLILAMAGGPGLTLGRTTMEPMFEFMRENKEKPFFVWYAPMLPHTPFDPPYKYLKYYQTADLSESAKTYYANCTWFDAGVGEILDFLHDEKLSDNTLLVYVNDNGWQQDPHVEYTDNFDATTLGGDRGKNSLHDFGFRTPVIFYWPGNVPPGKRRSSMISTVDLFPTILDYAGIKSPEGIPGHTLRPGIEGDDNVGRDVLIGAIGHIRDEDPWKPHNETGYYLRTHKWHYIVCDPIDMEELYDMENDPEAMNNVVKDHPDLAKKFRARIDNWRKEILGKYVDKPLNIKW
jgi:uncharacterized sulfatase